jgi:hypothetical protein
MKVYITRIRSKLKEVRSTSKLRHLALPTPSLRKALS